MKCQKKWRISVEEVFLEISLYFQNEGVSYSFHSIFNFHGLDSNRFINRFNTYYKLHSTCIHYYKSYTIPRSNSFVKVIIQHYGQNVLLLNQFWLSLRNFLLKPNKRQTAMLDLKFVLSFIFFLLIHTLYSLHRERRSNTKVNPEISDIFVFLYFLYFFPFVSSFLVHTL